MSDESAEIFVTIGEDRIQLVLPGQGWTYTEAKLAKSASDGMTPTEIEAGLHEMDPDAWLAVVRVSYVRAKKDISAREIANLDLGALMEAFYEAVAEALKDRPPTLTSENGSTARDEPVEPEPSEAPFSEKTT